MKNKSQSTRQFKTVKLVLYIYADQNDSSGLEEGVLYLTDERHKITPATRANERHFDSYDEIGEFVRELMDGRTEVAQ
jgi:hypothetical protein